mgnify:CR=1 FL=1
MAEYDSFYPPFNEDEDTIAERVFADADADIDKRPGEIFHDLVMPTVIEMARMWDSLNSMASVTFLPWSYGPYLDYKGAYEIGLTRQDPTHSYADVTFVGPNVSDQTAGDGNRVEVSQGTTVSTRVYNDADSSLQFTTQGRGLIGMAVLPEKPCTVTTTTDPVNWGNIPLSDVNDSGSPPVTHVFYAYTLVGRGGETHLSTNLESAEIGLDKKVSVTVPAGPNGTESRKIYRAHTDGSVPVTEDFYLIHELPGNAEDENFKDDQVAVWTGDPAPTVNTTDRVTISCRSVEAGENQNVPAGAINKHDLPSDQIFSVFNDLPASGGQDLEDDDDYRSRLIDAVELWQGQGNKDDYARWSLMDERVDDVVVLNADEIQDMATTNLIPYVNSADDAASRVHVVLIGPDNTPVSDIAVQEIQIRIDPSGWDEDIEDFKKPLGHGEGFAPIGALVTVRSTKAVKIDINVTVNFEDGYTLDGDELTGPTRVSMFDAVDNYFRGLPGDGDVVWTEVLAAIVTTPGISDVESLEIIENGGSGRKAVNTGQSLPIEMVEVPVLNKPNFNPTTP